MRKDSPMKRLFAESETLSWREETWPDVLALYFNEQLQFVRSYRDWTGLRVLDAATGYGRFAHALHAGGAKVYAVDVSQAMVVNARARDAQAHISWGRADIENLPFRSASFDAVVCMEALMHVPDPCAAVREFARVLRPGGFSIIGINNTFSVTALAGALSVHHAILRKLKRTPTVHLTHTIWQARRWLRDAGLELKEEAGVGLLHPETDIPLARGVRVRLVPHRAAKSFLSIERGRRLGRTWLRHAMKAILIDAVKPA